MTTEKKCPDCDDGYNVNGYPCETCEGTKVALSQPEDLISRNDAVRYCEEMAAAGNDRSARIIAEALKMLPAKTLNVPERETETTT